MRYEVFYLKKCADAFPGFFINATDLECHAKESYRYCHDDIDYCLIEN